MPLALMNATLSAPTVNSFNDMSFNIATIANLIY